MSEAHASGAGTGRVPPGQRLTDRLPVLHAGTVPRVDPASWDFTVGGLVAEALRLDFDEFRALPTRGIEADVHCVTGWSHLATRWEGVPVVDVLARARPLPEAGYVMVRAEHGFTANLPLGDFARPENLFAYRYAGAELEPAHGWPLRLVVPHLYFWKSAKWVRGFDLLDHDEPGFWERNGYHMYGDPWREQRYWGD